VQKHKKHHLYALKKTEIVTEKRSAAQKFMGSRQPGPKTKAKTST
jgi:hypothetical protein